MSRVLRYSIPVDGQAHYFTLNAGAKGYILGVSRVTTLTTRTPIGWTAYLDLRPLNRMLKVHWKATVGRYRW